jgi:hypothetical protein
MSTEPQVIPTNKHKNFYRPITSALPHGYQIVLLLRQARRDTVGRRVAAITRLLTAQTSICLALERLRTSEIDNPEILSIEELHVEATQ